MKKQLFITNALLSILGVLSLFFAFVRQFDADDDYTLAVVIIVIIFTCIISSAAIVFVKKSWIIYLIYAVLSLVFAVFFRKELIGGYMEYFNRVADAYSKYFHAEMYFAELTKKLKLAADTIMVMYFTLVFASVVFPVIIYLKKSAFFAGLISLLFMLVAVVIEKTNGILPCVMSAIFFIETIIISGSAKFDLMTAKNSFSLQLTAIIIGFIIIVCCSIASAIVPKEGYVKASYFDAMGDTAIRIYSNIEGKISSMIGNVTGNKEEESGGKKIIDDHNLGELGNIEYKNEELIKVNVSKLAGLVKIKQYIGQDYYNNTWKEPDYSDYNEFLKEISGMKYYPQTLISSSVEDINNDDYDYHDSDYSYDSYYKSYISIKYTKLSKSDELMPIYPTVYDSRYFNGEGYKNFLDEDTYIGFYNINNIKSFVDRWFARYGYDKNRDVVEQAYRKYVHENYLSVDNKYKKMFEFIGAKYGTQSYEEVFATAEYIRQYLASKCTYTLTPGELPKNKDFIEYFLDENKKGYCVHFATTAVMMLRANGIPARYVSGFNFDSNENVEDTFAAKGALINTVSVMDSSAHAWVEFYLDGFGWVEFDVTPGNFEKKEVPIEEETTSKNEETTTEKKTTDSEETTSKIEKTTNETTSLHKDDNNGRRLSAKDKKIIAFVALMFFLVVFLVSYILLRYRIKITNHKLKYDNNKVSNKEKCIQLKYNEFQCILKFVGISKDVGMSYEAFSKYVLSKCEYLDENTLEHFMSICEKASFSQNEISDEELSEIEKTVNELNEKVYSDLNFFKKISFKYLSVLR